MWDEAATRVLMSRHSIKLLSADPTEAMQPRPLRMVQGLFLLFFLFSIPGTASASESLVLQEQGHAAARPCLEAGH